MIQLLSVLIPSLIILIAMVEDLRTKKVKNVWAVSMAAVALLVAIGFDGWKSVPWSFLSLGTAFFLGFPLFMMGALGAADVKVFMAFSILLSWEAVIYVGVASLFWGALLGIIRSVLAGQGSVLASNVWSIVRFKGKSSISQLHHIPYTVALGFGWASYLVQTQPHFWGNS